MSIQLHLGKMTYEEIAQWRETSYTPSFCKKFKTREIPILKEYCEFSRYKENGEFAGINITKIFGPTEYIQKKSKGYKELEKYCLEVWVPQKQNGITTNSFTAQNYINDIPNHILSESTASKYLSKIYYEHFGNGRDKTKGISGMSEEVLGISIDHSPRILTKEEEDLYYSLFDEYILRPRKNRFEDMDVKQLAKDFSQIEWESKKDGLNRQEENEKFKEAVCKQDNFNYKEAWGSFRERFHEVTGGWPILGKKYDKIIEWSETLF